MCTSSIASLGRWKGLKRLKTITDALRFRPAGGGRGGGCIFTTQGVVLRSVQVHNIHQISGKMQETSSLHVKGCKKRQRHFFVALTL